VTIAQRENDVAFPFTWSDYPMELDRSRKDTADTEHPGVPCG
jgi:hypothetical protein